MTDQELETALASAAQKGAAKAIELHAIAVKSGSGQGARIVKQHPSWIAVVTVAIAMLTGLAGVSSWVNSISSRVSVVEAKQVADDAQLASVSKAIEDLAALKQELTDFRGDFRDWKRENGFGTPVNREMPSH